MTSNLKYTKKIILKDGVASIYLVSQIINDLYDYHHFNWCFVDANLLKFYSIIEQQ